MKRGPSPPSGGSQRMLRVGDGALVRVTGHVCRTVEQKDVCLHAQQIEAAGG